MTNSSAPKHAREKRGAPTTRAERKLLRASPDEIARYERIINERSMKVAPRPWRPRPVDIVEPDEQPSAPQHDEHVKAARRAVLAEAQKRRRPAVSKAERKRARAEMDRIEAKRKRIALANIAWDHRTAQGQRDIELVVGKSVTATTGTFANCFREKDDRTQARVLAWDEFLKIRLNAIASELPSPSYETPVQTSLKPGSVNLARIAAAKEDAELKDKIGPGAHALLSAIIADGLTYVQHARAIGQSERWVAKWFKFSLDLAAFEFGVGPNPRRASEVRRIFRMREPQHG